jgi:hypothetical protein
LGGSSIVDGVMDAYRGRRVREAFARVGLTHLLDFAFAEDLPGLRENIAGFSSAIGRWVSTEAPEWQPAMDALREVPVESLRSEITTGFTNIRALAQDVASGSTRRFSLTVQIYVPPKAADRDGRPGWHLDGGLADALVWVAVKLFAEVPRSLIRRCRLCPRVFVGGKNQKYCSARHLAEGQRLVQRKAEKAWRDRQQKKRKKRVHTTKKRRKTT